MMNCRHFQDQLLEYVDGSLSASAQAAVDLHLARCQACCAAVREEMAMAKDLSHHLRQRAEVLELSPEIRRDILAAARRGPAPCGLTEIMLGCWTRFAVPLTVGAAALVLSAVLWLNHFPGAPKPGAETARGSGRGPSSAVSVQLSGLVPICQFSREGNTVVDTLSMQTVVASLTLPPFPEK